ncbi:cell cycle arrest protein BUB3 [Fistulifera solaris]|uniref:Cell cycle arrest protein BUB3 n=1 Tax=Fistulifera solaris TaxID=1519565 RepID=A0A1Z5JMK1_FISSO|nr:cell cycle arrest protein BUB3 [Fistulifera solaris]|eukprot:GAX15237.1 cell cycle arrest protein BUB3 [Fistulifera solaris]
MEAPETAPEAIALPDPPTDGITSLRYLLGAPKSLLASTSWDGSVRVHDTSEQRRVFSHAMECGPLLSLTTIDSNDHRHSVVTGGMDGSIRSVDLETSAAEIIGSHMESETPSCSCLLSLADSSSPSLIASAGWDQQFHIWDIRKKGKPAVTVALPGKAYSMDLDPKHNRVALATSGRRTCFIDIRSGTEAELVLDRESTLKYQMRCIRFFPEGDGIAVGSVEGRVAVEYLEELVPKSNAKLSKYAFKCHRSGDVVYPVNCIEFHPRFGTFATAGCDGCVALWDGQNKKKLTTLPKLPTSISALAFNRDGQELAIASSYTFEDGEREHPHDEIYIRKMLDSECMPKTAK